MVRPAKAPPWCRVGVGIEITINKENIKHNLHSPILMVCGLDYHVVRACGTFTEILAHCVGEILGVNISNLFPLVVSSGFKG